MKQLSFPFKCSHCEERLATIFPTTLFHEDLCETCYILINEWYAVQRESALTDEDREEISAHNQRELAGFFNREAEDKPLYCTKCDDAPQAPDNDFCNDCQDEFEEEVHSRMSSRRRQRERKKLEDIINNPSAWD